MAIQNNPVGYASNAGYAPGANAQPVPAPAANQTYVQDSYAGTPVGADAAAPAAPTSLTAGLLGKFGIGHLVGALGGAFVGARYLLPRIALKLAPKVPPSMWLKLGVIGGSAAAGAWLLGKLFGGSKAAAGQQA